jgi:hypothetical protein
MQCEREHLVPVCDTHLLDDFLNVLVDSFDCSIYLRTIGRRIVMQNLDVLA